MFLLSLLRIKWFYIPLEIQLRYLEHVLHAIPKRQMLITQRVTEYDAWLSNQPKRRFSDEGPKHEAMEHTRLSNSRAIFFIRVGKF